MGFFADIIVDSRADTSTRPALAPPENPSEAEPPGSLDLPPAAGAVIDLEAGLAPGAERDWVRGLGSPGGALPAGAFASVPESASAEHNPANPSARSRFTIATAKPETDDAYRISPLESPETIREIPDPPPPMPREPWTGSQAPAPSLPVPAEPWVRSQAAPIPDAPLTATDATTPVQASAPGKYGSNAPMVWAAEDDHPITEPMAAATNVSGVEIPAAALPVHVESSVPRRKARAATADSSQPEIPSSQPAENVANQREWREMEPPHPGAIARPTTSRWPGEEPTVRIGRVDVIVQAPASPIRASPAPAPSSIASRRYLRSL
jgi:hypothetical protein